MKLGIAFFNEMTPNLQNLENPVCEGAAAEKEISVLTQMALRQDSSLSFPNHSGQKYQKQLNLTNQGLIKDQIDKRKQKKHKKQIRECKYNVLRKKNWKKPTPQRK